MKRIALMLLLAAASAALFTLFHKQKALPPTTPDDAAADQAGDVDLDFTKMNQTVQAAYLYKLVARPAEFEGRLIRFSGAFATTVDETSEKRYFGCVVGGPGVCPCCSQTIVFEFEPKDAALWSTNFPAEETAISVTGRLRMVRETSDGETYEIPRFLDCDVHRL